VYSAAAMVASSIPSAGIRGRRKGRLDRCPRRRRQLVEPAEEPNLDALGAELGRLASDRALEQAEEADDFLVGARPVLPAEGVQGQHRDAAANRVAQQAADRLDARGVAVQLGDAAAAGPTSVAVHDDCDVPGHVGAGILGGGRSGGLVGRAVPGVGLVGAGRCVGGADQRRARH